MTDSFDLFTPGGDGDRRQFRRLARQVRASTNLGTPGAPIFSTKDGVAVGAQGAGDVGSSALALLGGFIWAEITQVGYYGYQGGKGQYGFSTIIPQQAALKAADVPPFNPGFPWARFFSKQTGGGGVGPQFPGMPVYSWVQAAPMSLANFIALPSPPYLSGNPAFNPLIDPNGQFGNEIQTPCFAAIVNTGLIGVDMTKSPPVPNLAGGTIWVIVAVTNETPPLAVTGPGPGPGNPSIDVWPTYQLILDSPNALLTIDNVQGGQNIDGICSVHSKEQTFAIPDVTQPITVTCDNSTNPPTLKITFATKTITAICKVSS